MKLKQKKAINEKKIIASLAVLLVLIIDQFFKNFAENFDSCWVSFLDSDTRKKIFANNRASFDICRRDF